MKPSLVVVNGPSHGVILPEVWTNLRKHFEEEFMKDFREESIWSCQDILVWDSNLNQLVINEMDPIYINNSGFYIFRNENFLFLWMNYNSVL